MKRSGKQTRSRQPTIRSFYEGMIKVVGGVITNFPTIRIFNAQFKKGHRPWNILTSDSSGYVQLEFHSCRETDGATGAVNGGKFFPEFQGLMDLSRIPRIQAGGYVYRRGTVLTSFDSHTATVNDEVIRMVASTVNLPPVNDVRGIVYHIRNFHSSTATIINPNLSETIEGASTYSLPANGRVTIQADATEWIIL